jgi:hypothetical protein
MLVLPLINIESSQSITALTPVQNRQRLIPKDSQYKKLIIPQKSLDTNLNRVLRQIDQRDRKIAIKKALLKKELESQKAFKDSLWNIYTGNPSLYSTEGDTVGFGNVQYLPDSVFLNPNKKQTVVEKSGKPYGIEGKLIHSTDQEWLLGIILIVWIIFASVRVGFNSYIGQLVGGLVNVGTANRLYRERNYKTLYGAVRLNLIFHLILPLSVFQILHYYNVNLPGYADLVLYLVLLITINGYFFIKFFLYRVIGSILMLQEKIDESIFHMRIYYMALGIILLPIVTIHAAQNKIAGISVWIMCVLIGIFYLASLFRSIYIGNNKGISIFYLILYFCMLEIFPLIFVFKILARG